jgi:hypothetical protein
VHRFQGEKARIAVRIRERFGPVHVIGPFGVSGVSTGAFNPLDGLDEDSPDLAEDAALLADALIYDPQRVGEAHWNEEAKALVAGVPPRRDRPDQLRAGATALTVDRIHRSDFCNPRVSGCGSAAGPYKRVGSGRMSSQPFVENLSLEEVQPNIATPPRRPLSLPQGSERTPTTLGVDALDRA